MQNKTAPQEITANSQEGSNREFCSPRPLVTSKVELKSSKSRSSKYTTNSKLMFGHLFKTINQTVGRSGEKIFAEKDMHIAMLEDTLYNMGKDTKTFLNFFKKEVCLYNVTCNRLLAELEQTDYQN